MRPAKFSDAKGRPLKPIRPSFNMDPRQHAKAVKAAAAKGLSFTDWLLSLIDDGLRKA